MEDMVENTMTGRGVPDGVSGFMPRCRRDRLMRSESHDRLRRGSREDLVSESLGIVGPQVVYRQLVRPPQRDDEVRRQCHRAHDGVISGRVDRDPRTGEAARSGVAQIIVTDILCLRRVQWPVEYQDQESRLGMEAESLKVGDQR